MKKRIISSLCLIVFVVFSTLSAFADIDLTSNGAIYGKTLPQIVGELTSNPQAKDADTIVVASYAKDGILQSANKINPEKLLAGKYSRFEENFPEDSEYAKVFFLNGDDAKNEEYDLSFALTENEEPITKNPGKGWIRYTATDFTAKEAEEPGEQYAEEIALDKIADDYSTTGYTRLRWAEVEPEKGKYNWELIDNYLESFEKRGMKFAFGVMGLDTSKGGPTTPLWVVEEAKAAGESTWTHSAQGKTVENTHEGIGTKYLENYEVFLKAMAERYDGDPRIEFIDVRSYGNYGEFHRISADKLDPIGIDGMKKHISMHTDYFKKTQIIVATGPFYHSNSTSAQPNLYLDAPWIIEQGVGIRNDAGYTSQEWTRRFHGSYPAILEQGPHYQQFKFQYGFNIEHYMKCIATDRFSYLDLGEWGDSTVDFVREQKPVIDYLCNKMGYHFVLENVSMPKKVKSDENFSIKFDWINEGITYLYKDAVIDVAILDADGKVVKTFRSGANPTRNWAPGTPIEDVVNLNLADVENGTYKVAIGLGLNDVVNPDDGKPDFKIGNYGATDDNWYVFANLTKNAGGVVFSQYNQNVPQKVDTLKGLTYENVKNADFELNDKSWTFTKGAGFSSSDKASGTKSLAFDATEGASAQQTFKINKETIYNMTFKVKADGLVKAIFKDSNGIEMGYMDIEATNGEWKEFTLNFDCYDMGMEIFGDPFRTEAVTVEFKSDAKAFVDNIVITKLGAYEDFKAENCVIGDYGAETGYVPWKYSSSKIERSSKYAHSGTYSYALTVMGDWAGVSVSLLDSLVAGSGAGTYRFEGYFRADEDSYINGVRIQPFSYSIFRGSNDRNRVDLGGADRIETVKGEDGWVYFTKDVVISQEVIDEIKTLHKPEWSTNTAYVSITSNRKTADDWGSANFYGGTDTRKTLYFDDITLTKID
jgi:hypothetical protein